MLNNQRFIHQTKKDLFIEQEKIYRTKKIHLLANKFEHGSQTDVEFLPDFTKLVPDTKCLSIASQCYSYPLENFYTF